jgi:glycosyltransferase involved in cell wall biosynthesis
VADYAAGLLEELRKRGRVEVDAKKAAVHLYHLGNNQLHRSIYERAMARPGVVVLHDAVLQHFYLGAFNRERYIEEYVYNYGNWERQVAEDLWRERAGSGMDLRYFERPMLKRVGERALAVVVHNAAAAEAVRKHAPGANVIEIPHFFNCPYWPQEQDRARVRAGWGVGDETFVFGVFGYLRESKRLIPILRNFERLHQARPQTRLLIAGEFASSDLERAVAPWMGQGGISRTGYLDEREFWRVAGAVDACLNLRNPAAGETSGIGIRLMGLGKAVFFTAGPEIDSIPQAACVRVSPGLEESAELFDYMRMAAELPQLFRAIGARAAGYVRHRHSLAWVGDRYWTTLCAARASPL